MVDEVVAKKTFFRAVGSRDRYDADLGRAVGYFRDANSQSGFTATTKVRLVVERDNCTSKFWARNEVVTMFPIKEVGK